MNVQGSTTLKLNLGQNFVTNQEFQVVPLDSATKPLILGIDWLVTNGVSLHFSEGRIMVHGTQIPLLSQAKLTPSEHIIALATSISIPPKTQLITTARIQDIDRLQKAHTTI